jgi:hypothetical protein
MIGQGTANQGGIRDVTDHQLGVEDQLAMPARERLPSTTQGTPSRRSCWSTCEPM